MKRLCCLLLSIALLCACTPQETAQGPALLPLSDAYLDANLNHEPEPPVRVFPDIDGDGTMDTVDTGWYDDGYGYISCDFGGGQIVEYEFSGVHYVSPPAIGDFDGDGREEIAVVAEHAAGMGITIVKWQEDGFAAMTQRVSQNESLLYEQPSSLAPEEGAPVWTEVSCAGEEPLLYATAMLDAERGLDVCYGLRFSGDDWFIEELSFQNTLNGEPYAFTQEDVQQGTLLPSVERDGFVAPEIVFVNDLYDFAYEHDPELAYYDWYHNALIPPATELAVEAFRQLYNMTGFLVERCYAISAIGPTLYFSLSEDGINLESFFSSQFGAQGQCISLWYVLDQPYSPFSSADMPRPEDLHGMTDEQKAQWYYENSSFGDRREVVSTDTWYGDLIKLVLENGDFYESCIDTESGLPNYFYGPYPEGSAH